MEEDEIQRLANGRWGVETHTLIARNHDTGRVAVVVMTVGFLQSGILGVGFGPTLKEAWENLSDDPSLERP